MQPFNLILKELRGDRTQKEVADGIGVAVSTWAMYEKGQRTPRDEFKVKIAEYFHTTVQDIFYRPLSLSSDKS